MRLHRITLEHFKGVDACTVEFAPEGVTIIQGDNEVGKTTVAQALDLLLDRKAGSQAEVVRNAQRVGSDERPFVEAELTVGAHRMVYAKRFGAGAGGSTTLHVFGPDPVQLSGGEAHNYASQLLSGVADLDLWRALRLNQGGGFGQASANNHRSLVQALDRAAGGTTVDADAEASLFERVKAEYLQYHTPSGKPTGERKRLSEAVETAQAELDGLEQQLRELQKETERAARLEDDLAQIDPKLAEQRVRARQLEERRDEIHRLQRNVDQLGLEAERAERTAQAFTDQQRSRATSTELITNLEAQLVAARQNAEQARAAQSEAQQTTLDLRERQRDAMTLRDGARETKRAAEQASEALETREHVLELDSRISQANEAEEALIAADVRRSQKTRDAEDRALHDLEQAEHRLATARASAQAQAGSLLVRAHQDVTVIQSDADGQGQPHPLETAEQLQRQLTEPLKLRIGDVATVEVQPGADVDQIRRQISEAEQEFTRSLAVFGAQDVAEARRIHRAWQAASADHERINLELRQILDGDTLAELTRRRDRLFDQITPDSVPEGADREQLQLQVKEADERQDRAQRTLDQAGNDLSVQQEHERGLAERAAIAEHEVTRLTERRAEVQTELDELRTQLTDQELAEQVEASTQAAQDKRLAYRHADQELQALDVKGTLAECENAHAVSERIKREERELQDEYTALRAMLRTRGSDGLAEQRDVAGTTLERAQRDRDRTETKAAAANLLYERMCAYRDAARKAYSAPLAERIEQLGRIVFGHDFAVTLNDSLDIATRTLHGTTLEYERLSGGAREQLDVISRLACAAVVADDDAGVPLMLDDTLVYTDTERLKRLGAAISSGTGHAQVIILTCMPDRFAHVGDATIVRLP